jgi:hypothetical protein
LLFCRRPKEKTINKRRKRRKRRKEIKEIKDGKKEVVDLTSPIPSITRETCIFLFFLSGVHLLPYLENRIEDGFLCKRECSTKDIISFPHLGYGAII